MLTERGELKDGASLIAPVMEGEAVVPVDAAPATPSAAPGENTNRPNAGVATPAVAKALAQK